MREDRRKGLRRGTPERRNNQRPNGQAPQFGQRETSPESATEAPKIKRRLEFRALSLPSSGGGTRTAGRFVRPVEVDTPIGYMTQNTFESLSPVFREMLESGSLDEAAKGNLRSLLVQEGFSIHARDSAGRSDWLQQQSQHLFGHVRLAEMHASVMTTERNEAAAASRKLYAAGVAVTTEAQAELRSADMHYTELRERARIMNSTLAETEFEEEECRR